jgi:hypothetical protein
MYAVQVVSPPEVSFQKDCSPAEVRSLMRSTMDGTDKKLEAMVARVRKHLGGGSLFGVAWGAVKEQLLSRWVSSEHMVLLSAAVRGQSCCMEQLLVASNYKVAPWTALAKRCR